MEVRAKGMRKSNKVFCLLLVELTGLGRLNGMALSDPTYTGCVARWYSNYQRTGRVGRRRWGWGQASLEWQETGFRKCKCSFASRPAVEPELVEYRIKRKGGTREEDGEERGKRSRRREGGRGGEQEACAVIREGEGTTLAQHLMGGARH